MAYSFRIPRRAFEGRFVDHAGGIKDREVRVSANANAPFVLHVRVDSLQSPRRHESHLGERVRKAQSLLLAHVPPQYPRERSSPSRMPLAFLQVTVACDHDNWICNGGSSNLL